jgi:hypothetical protein
MRRLYRFIFDNSRWWWGKMAASTVIGMIIGAKSAHASNEPSIAQNWPMAAMIGAAVGFAASFFLMLNDYRKGLAVDDQTGESSLEKPRWSMLWMILGVVGICVLVMVGGLVWTIFSLSR